MGVRMDLAQGLLDLCKRAVAEERWDVADHLVAALETLCRTVPEARTFLEDAYLSLGTSASALGGGHRQGALTH